MLTWTTAYETGIEKKKILNIWLFRSNPEIGKRFQANL